MTELITSNTKGDILKLLENVKESFYLICPFIGINTSRMLADIMERKKIKATIITRFSRNDFYAGASSIQGLNILKNAGCELKAVKKLHTKLYIFDNDAIILGSSNFTDGGLISNVELNILIKEEKEIINHALSYFNEINDSIEEEYFITDKRIKEEIKFLSTLKGIKKHPFPPSTDFGKEIKPKKGADQIEKLLTSNQPTNAWIKFEGFSGTHRAKNNELLMLNLNDGIGYKTHFPKRPIGFKNNDLVFVARNSTDKNNVDTPMIFGYGLAQKFDHSNIVPQEERVQNPNSDRWPYFIYVKDFKYTNTLLDGISLLDVLREVGYNTYPNSSVRKSSFEQLKKVHGQKDKLRITDEAKEYLLNNLDRIL
jgi:HKD family nuclease